MKPPAAVRTGAAKAASPLGPAPFSVPRTALPVVQRKAGSVPAYQGVAARVVPPPAALKHVVQAKSIPRATAKPIGRPAGGPPAWNGKTGVLQRAEAKAEPGWFHCAACGHTFTSQGWPEGACGKCGSYNLAEGEAAAKSAPRAWVIIVGRAQAAVLPAGTAITAGAVDQKPKAGRMEFADMSAAMQSLRAHCRMVESFIKTINTANDIYDIATIKKLFDNEGDIERCYLAIEGLLNSIAAFGPNDWKYANMIGMGGTLRAWLNSPKRCITSLAQDLLRFF
ncbi:MAG: hypothetical protein V4631_09675 [Pseudomonadota bacterium]